MHHSLLPAVHTPLSLKKKSDSHIRQFNQREVLEYSSWVVVNSMTVSSGMCFELKPCGHEFIPSDKVVKLCCFTLPPACFQLSFHWSGNSVQLGKELPLPNKLRELPQKLSLIHISEPTRRA